MKTFARFVFPLLVILSLVLSACGTPAPTQAPAQPPAGQPAAGETAAAQPADQACGVVQLQYWNPFTGPDGPYMGEMVEAFNASHPDIQVTMTSQGEYYTQLATAAAAGTLPDVAILHADQVATHVFRNMLRPMDDLAAEMGISSADYPAGVWAAGEVAGRRYSIPLDIHPMTMFYNADLL
ncbi:MAG: extracellular solute-binding protein, partial [Anaerolineales bacterium]|nr:extracellular solute-binding protein [Anaerolineales bacterium]